MNPDHRQIAVGFEGRGGVEEQHPALSESGVFEQFLELAPDAIVGIDRSGAIALVNRQTERLFGYGRDELLGQAVEMLLPEHLREQHVGHRAAYFEDPRTRPMGVGLELYGVRRDGTEFPAEISLSSVEAGGEPLAIAAVRDVTERAEAERERQALMAEMEREKQREQASRLESVGQLAGGVAHDFNNLLGVVLNYADFIAEEIGEDSPAYVDVLEIRRAAERATELTRQLLIFSRREVVEPEPLDLNVVVEQTERLLRRTIGEHVELRVNLAPELPTVVAEQGQLEQVLVNLAVNARDAMPEGGKLDIGTDLVELDHAAADQGLDLAPGTYVRLGVSDTGSGMTPEVAERVFEPFFSTKRKGEGTGLGLATVYGIVKGAGGELTLDSTPGEGTTFSLYLPGSDGAVAARANGQPEAAPTGGGERILVVEDEDAVRTLATRILSKGGYSVTAVSRGSEAITLLERDGDQFDLLVSDVVMPEMRGIELVKRTRELNPGLPVLMMSGYTTPMTDEERSAIAKAPLLEKPFSGRTLLHRVGELLGSRKEG